MELKKFNFISSAGAFVLGTLYVFSDSASMTANVIGASGGSAGLTAIAGVSMIIGAIGLFIVSINSTDIRSVDLERLIRRTKDHSDLNAEPLPSSRDEERYRQNKP